jgi:hypothetical protein
MLKRKMSDSVLMVDAPVYLARRFHILRELKGIVSGPQGLRGVAASFRQLLNI